MVEAGVPGQVTVTRLNQQEKRDHILIAQEPLAQGSKPFNSALSILRIFLQKDGWGELVYAWAYLPIAKWAAECFLTHQEERGSRWWIPEVNGGNGCTIARWDESPEHRPAGTAGPYSRRPGTSFQGWMPSHQAFIHCADIAPEIPIELPRAWA